MNPNDERGLLARIRADIDIAYESRSSPDFQFVRRVEEQAPYRNFVREFSARFSVSDETDLNDDVSFVYSLRGGDAAWLLQLSMVGPYAVVMRMVTDERPQLLADAGATSNLEDWLLDGLQSHHIVSLGGRILEARVPLALHNAEPENVLIFQALFSDVDGLPWISSSPNGSQPSGPA